MDLCSDIVLLGATVSVSVSISDSRAVCSEVCSVWHPVFRDAVSFPSHVCKNLLLFEVHSPDALVHMLLA